jgi:hypothetical protein
MQSGAIPPSTYASSSTNPLGGHEHRSGPAPLPAYHREDVNAIKQQLQDVLGDQGLPYWRACGEFLDGHLRRDEYVGMVTKWLKGNGKSATRGGMTRADPA